MDWDDALGVALEGLEPPADTRETRNLARITREGSSYRRSYTAQSMCSASRATLLDCGGYVKAYPVWGTDLALSMPKQVATDGPVIVRIELSAAAVEGSGGDPRRQAVRFSINDGSATGTFALAYDRAARSA